MNILVVSQYYWPEGFIVNELCEQLVKRGHKVTVLTGVPNYPSGKVSPGYSAMFPKSETHEGVLVKRVPIFPRGNSRSWRLLLNYLSFAIMGSLLGPFKCLDKYDAVFVMQLSPVSIAIPGIVMKKLRNVPMLMWVQDLWPESLSATGAIRSEKVIGYVRKLVGWIYKNCDLLLTQSQAFQTQIKKSFPFVDQLKFMPNWAPSSIQAVSSEKSIEQEKLNFLFAGNIGVAQNLKVLVDAAKLLENEDIIFSIVGDGRELANIKKKVENLKLQKMFRFLGRHPVEKMPNFFSQADALLVTLKADPIFSITIPSKVQAYMASSKPLIAALDGEGRRVVEESQSGICCKTESSQALASSIQQFICLSDDERKQMGKNGHAYFLKHFEREKVLDDLEANLDIVCR